jgi:Cation/multidrug efflux pump
VAVLLVGAIAFIPLKWVTVKMLPFDNKSEFQVIVNTPEGTTLEETAAVARRLKQVLVREPEVTDVEMYAGTAAPYNFNGLIEFLQPGGSTSSRAAATAVELQFAL